MLMPQAENHPCQQKMRLLLSDRSGDGVRETKGSGDADRVGGDRVRQTRLDAGSSGVEETGADRFFEVGVSSGTPAYRTWRKQEAVVSV